MSNDLLPKGLLEEELLIRLLNEFITKLEKSKANSKSRLPIKISEKKTPELFQPNDYDVPYLWGLIKSLENKYDVLTIKLLPSRSTKEDFEGATLFFKQDKEMLVRCWLNRPKRMSDTEQWTQALMLCSDRFTPKQINILNENRVHHNNKTAAEVLDALACVHNELQSSNIALSCRTLSARHFDGDSKFLDRREDLLRQFSPEHQTKIKIRPLLLSVAIPPVVKNVLFIENQETFLMCVDQHQHVLIENTALVYSGGFRAASMRGRSIGDTTFAFVNIVDPVTRTGFELWWYKEVKGWSCYFWGDLDYDGMRILSTLRNVFPGMEAWKPGYRAMLQYHKKGVNHIPSAAKKENQRPLSKTGCEFADNTLLPILEDSQRFLDQEVVADLNDIV